MVSYTTYQTRTLLAPKDDLFSALDEANIAVREGDILVVSSKVVSIHEGRCIKNTGRVLKDELAKRESKRFIEIKRSETWKSLFTETEGVLIGRAGIDESNGNGYFVLYPRRPMASAEKIRAYVKGKYNLKNLGVIIADSRSTPLRRGAIGFALGWAGFLPLKDYRKTKDLFGRAFEVEIANLADGLAAGAVAAMGEGNEQTPVAVISGAPVVFTEKKRPQERMVKVTLEDDLFSPFLLAKKWKRGGAGKKG